VEDNSEESQYQGYFLLLEEEMGLVVKVLVMGLVVKVLVMATIPAWEEVFAPAKYLHLVAVFDTRHFLQDCIHNRLERQRVLHRSRDPKQQVVVVDSVVVDRALLQTL
jgi:hypothetical protein